MTIIIFPLRCFVVLSGSRSFSLTAWSVSQFSQSISNDRRSEYFTKTPPKKHTTNALLLATTLFNNKIASNMIYRDRKNSLIPTFDPCHFHFTVLIRSVTWEQNTCSFYRNNWLGLVHFGSDLSVIRVSRLVSSLLKQYPDVLQNNVMEDTI